MDKETHRPREEPENEDIHEEFPGDPGHERAGLAGEPGDSGTQGREAESSGAAPRRPGDGSTERSPSGR
ncbi:MAG: hypothetical protein JWM85_2144 [Acidimicrobiaceae bacterium]|nr:hypothetical protein [Acidimicrobiaceae bacterium]